MKVKLSQAFDLQMGKTPSRNIAEYWGGDHKWVSIADIGNAGKYISETKECITDDGVSGSGIKVVPKGTVIMSFKLSIGKTAITSEDMYTNEAIMAFIDKGIYPVDPNYLYHLCCGTDWTAGTNKAVMGLTLNKATLSEKMINLPSVEEQKDIAEKLDEVDSLINIQQRQLAKLDELVKARFIELFGDLHSTKFPKCKMAEICNIKHGYAFSGEFFTEEDNNILLVTPGNFKVGGGFQEKKCKFFMGEYSEEYVLNCGDLIVTMTDLSKNMDTLGYSAIVPSTNRVYLHNQRIGLFVGMSENINKVFLMYFMQTNEYRDSIIASATGSTVHHTSPSKILDCDIFLPPIELQDQFAAFVEQTDKSKLAVKQSLEKLETLKQSLMQQYFG